MPATRLLHRKYRELVRNHLSHMLERLFAEFTGLHFHVAWRPVWPKTWDSRGLPTGCSVCCRLRGSPSLPDCHVCGPQRLAAVLGTTDGHLFTCRPGVRNFWYRIHIRGETLGIAYLQALKRSRDGTADNRRPHSSGHRARAVVVDEHKFALACRLLRLIVQHVTTASVSDLRKLDLHSAGRAVVALEREQARLHHALHRHLPPTPQAPRASTESHADQVIHSLLERIELDYAQPLTLQRFARDLGMNSAYLSALFSRGMGIPFKAYLTEVRLQKAREMLGDFAKTASDVAFAVGYSSEERFRCAFKKATGLSPKAWRETMHTDRQGAGN